MFQKRIRNTVVTILCLVLLTACAGSSGGGTSTTTQANPSQGSSTTQTETGGDAEYRFSLSWEASETSTGGMALVYMKEALEELSGGRIACDVYQNAQLGTSREVIEGVQSNQITMMLCIPSTQMAFVPDLAVFDMPFAIKDQQQMRDLLEDEAMYEVFAAKYKEANLHWLCGVDGGFRTLSANKNIETPDDVSGLVIRTPDNPYQLATWNNIGANAVPMAYAELFTALQQGTVDCQDNPLEMVASNRLYEVQSDFMQTNHVANVYMMIMNEDYYQSLPEDIRGIIDEAAVKTYERCCEFYDESYGNNVKIIEDYGCTIHEISESNIELFKEKALPVWEDIKGNVSPEVYDAYVSFLGV